MALEDIDSLVEKETGQSGHTDDHKKIVRGLKSVKDIATESPRGEIASASTNSVRAVASTTVGAIPGLDIVVDVKDKPVYIKGTIPYATASAIPTTLIFILVDVTDGGAIELDRTAHDFSAVGTQSIRTLEARINAGSGVRRYQLRAGLFSGTNSVDLGISSNSTLPRFAKITAVEL